MKAQLYCHLNLLWCFSSLQPFLESLAKNPTLLRPARTCSIIIFNKHELWKAVRANEVYLCQEAQLFETELLDQLMSCQRDYHWVDQGSSESRLTLVGVLRSIFKAPSSPVPFSVFAFSQNSFTSVSDIKCLYTGRA